MYIIDFDIYLKNFHPWKNMTCVYKDRVIFEKASLIVNARARIN